MSFRTQQLWKRKTGSSSNLWRLAAWHISCLAESMEVFISFPDLRRSDLWSVWQRENINWCCIGREVSLYQFYTCGRVATCYEEVPVLGQWKTASFTPSYKSLWIIQILLINALLTEIPHQLILQGICCEMLF